MARRVRGVESVVGARAREAQGNAVTVAERVDVRFKVTQTTFLFVYTRTKLLNVTRIGQAGHERIGTGAVQPAWRFRTRLTNPAVRTLRRRQLGMDRIGLDRIGLDMVSTGTGHRSPDS